MRFAAAVAVHEVHRRAVRGHIAVAPVPESDENGVEVVTLGSEAVLLVDAVGGLLFDQDLVLDQAVETVL
jgi:hypothetical protein